MKQIIYSKETEQQCIYLINIHPYYIRYIINPSEELQKLAVQQNGCAIQYINNPSEEIQKLVVKQNGFYIQYIKNPTKKVQKLAIINFILHNDLSYFNIDKYCPNISKQWIEEQKAIRNILK